MVGCVDLGISSVRHGKRCNAGVYFLWNKGSLLYVGQSTNVVKRICEHARDKDFDCSTFEPLRERDMYFVESYLIWFLKPPLNKQIPVLGSMGCNYDGKICKASISFVVNTIRNMLCAIEIKHGFCAAEQRILSAHEATASIEYKKYLRKLIRKNKAMEELTLCIKKEATDGPHTQH